MTRRPSRRGRGEGGQMAPVLTALTAAVLLAGVALFQVGRTTDLKARAQTAADAAALAAAQAIRGQYVDYLRVSGPLPVERVGLGLGLLTQLGLLELPGRAAAEDYADRNGARVVSYEQAGNEVVISVETIEQVDGRVARRLGVEGTRAQARARAGVIPRFLGLPRLTSPPPVPVAEGAPPPVVTIDPAPLFTFRVRLVALGG